MDWSKHARDGMAISMAELACMLVYCVTIGAGVALMVYTVVYVILAVLDRLL